MPNFGSTHRVTWWLTGGKAACQRTCARATDRKNPKENAAFVHSTRSLELRRKTTVPPGEKLLDAPVPMATAPINKISRFSRKESIGKNEKKN